VSVLHRIVPIKTIMLSVIKLDIRRNGKLPKSQPTKKSICQKVDRLKTSILAFWSFYVWVDVLEVDHFT
jgi:hypothetical protein